MVANYTSGPSVSSDTLRTIFLNINTSPSLDDIRLTYNHLREPKLITSSNTFSITKEYPIGTTNTLAITSATLYPDTITLCGRRINYQVFLRDNSGCISQSNLIEGNYYDTKAPDTTYVDSVSVLPNGNVAVSWTAPPYDKDVVKYYLMQKTNPLDPNSANVYFDTIYGRLNTTYTLSNTLANTQVVSLFVAALDSCPKQDIGLFNPVTVTMYLKTVYNSCAYETELSWNAYKGMRKGIKAYKIYYSTNGGAFTVVGTTTATTFTHKEVDPQKDVCYFVRVVNTDESVTASSNRSCFYSKETQVPSYLYVRSATVLDDNSVMVNVHIDPMKPTVGLDIFRSEDGINYITVGSLPYNGGSFYSFTDTQALPATRSYFYKAVLKDSCGNSRSESNAAKTILLKVNEDRENIFSKHLSWNDYAGFAGSVSGYKVYRSVNDNAPMLVVTLLPQVNSYTDNVEDEAASGARIDYFIQAQEGPGNPYGIADQSNSNKVPVYMEGRLYVPTAFAPSGSNKTWKPYTHFIEKSEYHVSVFNRWGKKVFETSNDTDEWNGENCMPDVYVYQVSFKNARGEYQQLHGTVILLK
jgi:hypothetical protein